MRASMRAAEAVSLRVPARRSSIARLLAVISSLVTVSEPLWIRTASRPAPTRPSCQKAGSFQSPVPPFQTA